MSLSETTFICTLILLAFSAFLVFMYLNKVDPTDTKKHIKQVASSWVWMLTLLFGAYWLGEMATAIIIVVIGIKGLHEISCLQSIDQVFTEQDSITEALKPNRLLTLALVTCLLLMVASWLELNQLLTQQNQRSLMLLMLFVVQFNDVNQYIAGKFFGHKLFKRKLAPTISPNKTIEGAIFGTLTTAILALPIGFALTDLNLRACFMISVVMGLCGISGDLFQSAVKRNHNVKDMGAWIKGHGGIMDRVDSLLLAVPVFLFIYSVISRL